MNSGSLGESYVIELLNLFDRQGAALFSGANSLCLTLPCLHYIQAQMAAVFGGVGGLLSGSVKVATPPSAEGTKNRATLRLLEERLGKVIALKLIPDKQVSNPQVILNLAPFRSLQVLILKKVHIKSISNLQLLRTQLKTLIVQRCQIEVLHELLVTCGTDDATPIVWGSLKELDVSMNALKDLGQCLQYVPFLEKANFSNNCICDSIEGMEAIDKLEFLHLGFNQLKSVPRFANRTRYHLKVFNLRNNCLEHLEGLEALESLSELDLTDNMLCSFTALKPLRALNNLHILQLAGNPLAYQDYRIKAAGYLSSMINKDTFALDGKKLSSSEQKAVPREEVFPVVGTPSVPIPQSPQVSSVILQASPKPAPHPKVKRKQRKKAREILLDDNDVINASETDGTDLGTSSTFVPLDSEGSLQQEEILRKQLQDNWLLSKMGLNGAAVLTKEKKVEPSRQDAEVMVKDSEHIAGNGGTELERAPLELGETFMAELYDSDSEDQGGQRSWHQQGQRSGEEKRVFLSFTERFFTEKDISTGKQLDKMDLQSLTSAVIEKRRGRRNELIAVLVLTFNSGRRDKRKREYTLLEDDEHQKAILNILQPIIDENKGVSITTKLECLKCCRVFDSSQAMRDPSSSDEPSLISSPYSRPKNLCCPHCFSLILETVPAQTSALPPLKQPLLQEACPPAATASQVVSQGASIRIGFDPVVSQGASIRIDTVVRPDVIPSSEGSVGRSLSNPVPSPVLGRPKPSRSQSSIEQEATYGGGVANITSHAESGDSTNSAPPITSNSGLISSAPPTTNPQIKHTVDGSGPSTQMGSRDNTFKTSLQLDSHIHLGRSHAPIPEEESSSERRKGSTPPQTKQTPSPPQAKQTPSPPHTKQTPSPPQTKHTPSPPHTKHTPSPPQTNRDPFPSQDVISNSAVAKGTSQTGRGGTVQFSSSSSGDMKTGSLHHKSTNPFHSDEEVTSHDQPSPSPNSGVGVSSLPGPSTLPSHLTLHTRRRSKSQDLRKVINVPKSSIPSDPFDEATPSPPPPSSSKRTSWTTFPSRRQQGTSPKSWHTSSDTPLGSRVPSPTERPRQSSSDLQQSRYSVASDFVNNIGKGKDRRPSDVPPSPQPSTVYPVTSHSIIPYKKEDPGYVHNSINLYLDMEVFNTEEGERFAMIFKSSLSHYNTGQQYDAVFVASNYSAYVFKIIGPIRSSPEKWLQLVSKSPLKKLVYIDIGVGHQTLRLEFDLPGVCYTFLLGDEQQCDCCATKLSFVVSDVRNSSFKSIGVCPFSLQSIRDPQQFLQQEMKNLNTSAVSGSEWVESGDEQLRLLLHTGHRLPRETVWSRVTLVVSNKCLFMAQENYDQWPLPKLHMAPGGGALRAPFSNVTYKEVTDVEKLVRSEGEELVRSEGEELVRHSQRTISIHFFKESVAEGELSNWNLHMYSHVSVDKLIGEVSSLWRDEFQTDLGVVLPPDTKGTPPDTKDTPPDTKDTPPDMKDTPFDA
ncbi:hypothetical protein EMCRGX_G017545 [Ephydatia muelleri]